MNPNEYVPIILDIGDRAIRAGIAGEHRPSVQIAANLVASSSTKSLFPSFLETEDHSLTDIQREELHKTLEKSAHYTQLSQIYGHDQRQWLNCNDDVKLNLLLFEVFTQMAIPTRNCKVVVIDRKFSNLWKLKILNVLLTRLRIKSVIFYDEPILSVVGANVRNGLVVNFDWSCVTTNVVVDLRIINTYEFSTECSGAGLHYLTVLKLIQMESPVVKHKDLFHIVEKFLNDVLYDSHGVNEESEGMSGIPRELYGFMTEEITVKFSNLVEEIVSIVALQTLDNRAQLLDNVIVTGSVASIPRFKTKFLNQLNEKLNSKGIFTLGSWSGGSMFVSTKLINQDDQWRKHQYTRERLNSLVDNNGYKLAAVQD